MIAWLAVFRDLIIESVDVATRPRLETHVMVFAGVVGERNSSRLSSIDAARTYIVRQVQEMGLKADLQPYTAPVCSAANIATLPRDFIRAAGCCRPYFRCR